MKIPKIVRVGSRDYAVEFVEHAITVDNMVCYAKVDFNNGCISINGTIANRQRNEISFLHELVHAILAERAVDIGDVEEVVAEAMARGLHQVIRDNPEIFL